MDDRVLVTGGSRNIGRGICERLQSDGIQVIQLDCLKPENPDSAEFIEVDLSDRVATSKVLSEITSNYLITRVVNNVGISVVAKVEEASLDDFDRVLRLNTEVALQCVQALVPQMKEVGFGRIVNIASRAIVGIPELSVYAASKSAVVGLMKTWAMELAGYGITSNAVAPGPIDTDMLRGAYTPEVYDQTRLGVPVGRFGNPADIANAVSFLLDERSSFVNGQVLHVCGGMSIGRAG
ncbi:MAG: short-chain dehydrogenase [Rhodospirillaceae bacterium]|nr:short-chain dehydrogenase [Rhodospirillaceae bacterium]